VVGSCGQSNDRVSFIKGSELLEELSIYSYFKG
jgi:hypothetical protein